MKNNGSESVQIVAGGDLLQRAHLNFDRMESDLFEPVKAFKPEEYEWPGDNEGRLILALALLAQTTHREPLNLKTIMNELPNRMNGLGFYGNILPEGEFDEQQLSGNGWLLRGLCEVYEWKKEPHVRNMIERLVRGLFLPVRGYYRLYPSNKDHRRSDGAAVGSLVQDITGHWYISTDVGCAFIALDGVTRAFELLGWPELKELIHEMISSFLSIDLLEISAQTHATLSALRGILRMVELEGDSRLLESAEGVYDLYRQQGMTENYANYNWFGRPDWTEPCAVIDAYLVALTLWRITGKPGFLQDSHLIYYNGICRGQRHNGGFGCDCCSGAGTPYLYAMKDIYEAFWCCSMRGAEGWFAAAQSVYTVNHNNLYITAYHDHTASVRFPQGRMEVSMTTRYPYNGYTRFGIIDSDMLSPVTLHFFVPSWFERESVCLQVNGQTQPLSGIDQWISYSGKLAKGDVITLQSEFGAREEDTINIHSISPYISLWHGPLILSAGGESEAETKLAVSRLSKEEFAVYRQDSGEIFSPVYSPIQQVRKEDLLARKQLLFRNEQEAVE